MLILNVLQKGICSWMVLFDNKLYSDWWKRQQWRNINSPVVVFFTGHYAKIEPIVAPSPILIFLFFVSLLYLLHLPSIFALASYYLGYFHYCCSSLRQLLDHVYLGYCLFKHVHSKTIFSLISMLWLNLLSSLLPSFLCHKYHDIICINLTA